MKKIRIALICAALSCVVLSGCTSDQLKSTQKTERQALGNKQQADRQVERAQTTLAASTATTAAAAANLAAKKQKQQQADADLQQILCPQSASSAGGSAASAASDEELAHKWADNPEDMEVQGGEFSAFHWAQKAKETVSDGAVISITSGQTVLTPDTQGNITLGTAATATLTTSTTDGTAGHVLKIGDHGVGEVAIRAIDTALSSAAGYPSGFFSQGGNPDDNRYSGFGAGVNLLYGVNPDTGTFSGRMFVRFDGHLIAEWLQVNPDGTIAAQHANELYGTLNKPSPWDTGAMPLYPTPLVQGVDLNTLGAITSAGIYNQTTDAYAVPELNYPTTQAGTLLITPTAYGCMQEYTTFGSGQKFVRGLRSNFDGDGPWWSWYPQYSPSNPPDLSAYATQAWVMANFVQSFQFGAVTQVAVSGNQYPASPGCVLSAIQDNDTGSYPAFDSVDAVYQKPAQVLINGVGLRLQDKYHEKIREFHISYS